MTDLKANTASAPYAVVEHGGSQFRVEAGDVLVVDRVPADAGAEIEFGRAILFENAGDIRIGKPGLDNVKVKATVIAHERGEKILIFKFKKTKNYRRRRGHRQEISRIRIDSISF